MKKYNFMILVLMFLFFMSCSLFKIPDSSKDKELQYQADSLMLDIDSLINAAVSDTKKD